MAQCDSENLQTFSLLWLDAEVNSEKNQDVQQQLRATINQLKTFEDPDECLQYIQQTSKEDRLALIVSDQWSQEVVPSIHQLQQVSLIYVYYRDKMKTEAWAKEFTKVAMVYSI